jgi:hypothetical protein
VSHGTRQSDSPFLYRHSPACPCLWLPQRRWRAVSILEDRLAGVVRRRRPWHTPSCCTVVTELVFANCRIQNAFCCGVAILQHGLPWRRWPKTLSRVKYKQTLRAFQTIVVYREIVCSLITSFQHVKVLPYFLSALYITCILIVRILMSLDATLRRILEIIRYKVTEKTFSMLQDRTMNRGRWNCTH